MIFIFNESKPYYGILCYLKDSLQISYNYKVSYDLNTSPNSLICNRDENVDFYAYPTDFGNYLEFIFPRFVFAKINKYSILGRSFTNNHNDLMQTWELKGLTPDNKWVTLNSQYQNPVLNYQRFVYPAKSYKIKGIRIQVTGESYQTTHSNHKYINTMGGIDIFFFFLDDDDCNTIRPKSHRINCFLSLITFLIYS